MSKLIRYYSEGNIYFVTAVTHQRKPILVANSDLFWDALTKFRERVGFTLLAWVILPDHIHLLIDPKEHNLSRIIQRVKVSFAKRLKLRAGVDTSKVWQSRFWDHIIRDSEDMGRHLDYIHYNPVKHGLVKNNGDWQFSSFQDFLRSGYYQDDWGCVEPAGMEGGFGE